jgi:signal transduction histidine kinase
MREVPFLAENQPFRAGGEVRMHRLNAQREGGSLKEPPPEASQTDFLSMVTHGLRSPIAALRLQVANLRRNPESAMDSRRLERIARQVERLSILVQNLLDVTRASTGAVSLDLEEDLELGEVVCDALEKLQPEIALRAAVIHLHQVAAIRGTWDRLRLEQIATNLLSNAIQYGGSQPIDLWLQKRAERALMVVQDRGIGIEPGQLKRLFDRFERLATDTRTPGVGLGLWIVRHAAEAMGGTVSVDSQLGVGSTFMVDLPLRPKQS